MKLFTSNFGGNLHQSAKTINELCPEIVPGIITMDCLSGNNTIVVYRAKQEHPKLAPRPTTASTPWGQFSVPTNGGT